MPYTETTLRTPASYHVTTHFMYSDFICPCCDRLRIVPGFYTHVELLERLRGILDFDIAVTSGYRCKSHNAAVGGAPNSWHLLFATDIQSENGSPGRLTDLYKAALTLNFGGIGLYEKHIHLDLRPDPVRWRG